ncbi:MAG: rane protein [Defluviitaleaceae bacterium]|jgi:niacin transporter|uniref:ECF transporter S component n=1 Tax=Defluviitalea raffinosedens TaxID=1450156 RepID=A0A7C8HEX6_9FIRM|nr:ECF transporter S component [Defluviitalea raffinosedens]KAE9634971.1 ECF transporter S component [Defluviitalea raffinosedens]MBZ4668963.1 rane protein [Defluviitaleaceae bacterium]
MNTKKLTIAALLTALAIVIPFAVFFKVVIPPFTATLGSHVPMFIAMFFGPEVAIMVGIGSALGFFLNLGVVVGARAFMHVFVGLAGAMLIKKGMSFGKVSVITAPLHGLLEVLVVVPFIGFDVYKLLVVTGIGTVLHHFADAFISYLLVNVLQKSAKLNLTNYNN